MKKVIILIIAGLISMTLIYVSLGKNLNLQNKQKANYTAVLPVPYPEAPNHNGF